MSLGSPKLVVRISKCTVARIRAYLTERSENPLVEPWTLTDFIKVAVREKLDKIGRGRKKPLKSIPHQTEDDVVDLGKIIPGDDPLSGVNFNEV